MKLRCIFGVCLCYLLTACSGSEPLEGSYCDENTVLGCLPAYEGYMTCVQNKMVLNPCEEGETCQLLSDKSVGCLPEKTDCILGTKSCSMNGLLKTCGPDNTWVYSTCPLGCVQNACVEQISSCNTSKDCNSSEVCSKGVCKPVDVSGVACKNHEDCALGDSCKEGFCVPKEWVEPECYTDSDCSEDFKCVDNQCIPKVVQNDCSTDDECNPNEICSQGLCIPQMDWIVQTKCGKDGKSVDFVYKNSVITKSCEELTGFDTECKTFANGNDGCTMPATCGAITTKGYCHENTVVYCAGEPEKIVQMDCTATHSVCAERRDGAYCFTECEKTEFQTSCKLTNAGFVLEVCGAVGDKTVIQQKLSTCASRSAENVCDGNGKIKKQFCKEGSECHSVLGYCTSPCAKEGELLCEDGVMKKCTQVGNALVYEEIPSRQCDGDNLSICSENGMKVVNCRTDMTDNDGNYLESRCEPNLMGTGMAICYPVEHGDPCPKDLTDDGKCQGNKLQVCNEIDNVMWESDCSQNKLGATQCSVIHGYSDCRVPCTEKNTGSCIFDDDAQSYILNLCMEDETNPNTLTWVQASSICSDDLLYLCDKDGNVIQQNCADTGGLCNVTVCEYPACYTKSDELQCTGLEGNTITQCLIHESGYIEGQILQDATCENANNICTQGKVQACL